MSGAPERLEPILRDVRARAAARRARWPLSDLRALAPDPRRRERFVAALRAARGGLAILAECKRRSPSAGALEAALTLEERAGAYARGGASALSILTEEDHFGGAPEDLGRAAGSGLPLLRKDFLLDEGMVRESQALGADAVLLIAEALPGGALRELRACAREAGLAVLIEAFDAPALERAIEAEPECVGINARDLKSFRVETARAFALLREIPERFVRVAESGLRSAADLLAARDAGADVALVGEALMRVAAPDLLLRRWRLALSPPRVKVCGITTVEDARAAIASGAEALGVVLGCSPRRVGLARAREIVHAAGSVPVIGVFADAPPIEVVRSVSEGGLAAAQLCGAEEPAEFADVDFPIWRRVPADARGAGEIARWRARAELFVIDHPSSPGGSGRSVEAAVARSLAQSAPCLLAGGLAADNVAQLVAAVRPCGVDASSRLESAPGEKDPARVRAFVSAARAALGLEVAHG